MNKFVSRTLTALLISASSLGGSTNRSVTPNLTLTGTISAVPEPETRSSALAALVLLAFVGIGGSRLRVG